MTDEINIAQCKRKLLKQKEVLQEKHIYGRTPRTPVILDQTRQGRLSRIDALQQQAMDVALGERRENELRRIDAALARIATDEYGICVICGETIAAARLRHDPTAAICAHHAK